MKKELNTSNTMKSEVVLGKEPKFIIRPLTEAEIANKQTETEVAFYMNSQYKRDGMNASTHKDGLLWKHEDSMLRPAIYNLAMAFLNAGNEDMAFILLNDLADNGYQPALELTGGL
ncbi:hypothetical protein [Candidatus Sulfurimonas baltica]|uniref:Uncharacterized protein n=1 Tax=Candidatus Sulfurimonas baltica TaxID=2740404 RepID=A0A7S7LXM3_9BACT|nr:hypothetical protein [Candidatus Sulfurimonas baltica]QOY52474.1 hypothetical protein HUE88_01900 [Candidatus Sulfurimonas baltica]